jgi:hypothetical protein
MIRQDLCPADQAQCPEHLRLDLQRDVEVLDNRIRAKGNTAWNSAVSATSEMASPGWPNTYTAPTGTSSPRGVRPSSWSASLSIFAGPASLQSARPSSRHASGEPQHLPGCTTAYMSSDQQGFLVLLHLRRGTTQRPVHAMLTLRQVLAISSRRGSCRLHRASHLFRWSIGRQLDLPSCQSHGRREINTGRGGRDVVCTHPQNVCSL